MSKNKYTFVQKEVIPQQPPPLTQAGITGWLWKNLFSSMSNFSSLSSSIQSLVMIVIYGRYPADELWRVNTVYIVLLLGIGYTLFEGAKGRQWTGMAMLTIFPLFALILLTGANFNIGWDTLRLQLGISILLILLGETSRRDLFGKILFESTNVTLGSSELVPGPVHLSRVEANLFV